MKQLKYLLLLVLIMTVVTSCGLVGRKRANGETKPSDVTKSMDDNNNESITTECKLYLDFVINNNENFQSHDVKIIVDEEEPIVLPDKEYYTKLMVIEKGNHSIKFVSDESDTSNNIESFEVNNDMSIKCYISYVDDVLTIDSFEFSDSIADSAIVYGDMRGIQLQDALDELGEKHFVNVKYNSTDDSDIVNLDDWIVESQNVSDGDVLDKTDLIELTCRKNYFQLYFDLEFDTNLFLATYDVDMYLDGENLTTIKHGNNYSNLIRVREGEHVVKFYKSTDNTVCSAKNINVTGDCTLKGRIHTNSKDIELNDFNTLESIEGASIEVLNVTGFGLSDAMKLLAESGFANVREEPNDEIWDRDNWIVVSQDIAPGSFIDKNERITLNCVKKSEYAADNFLSLSVSEVEKKTKELNCKISYKDYINNSDMNTMVSSMSEEEKDNWKVRQTSLVSDNIVLGIVYSGNVEMPNLIGKTVYDAVDELEKLKFSAVETVTNDDSIMWDSNNWEVIAQSVDGGKTVNANGKITLKARKKESTTSNSSNSAKEKESTINKSVNYSTNTLEKAKEGNSGIFAYKSRGGTYDNYYVIDFDEGYVYFFSEGNGTDYGDKLKIQSGDLNEYVLVTYNDDGLKWSNGLHFKWKKQPDHLVLQDQDGFEYDFYGTDLDKALEIMKKKKFTVYN